MGNQCCGGDDSPKTEHPAPLDLKKEKDDTKGGKIGTATGGTADKESSDGASTGSTESQPKTATRGDSTEFPMSSGANFPDNWQVPVCRHELHLKRMAKKMGVDLREVKKPVFKHTKKLK